MAVLRIRRGIFAVALLAFVQPGVLAKLNITDLVTKLRDEQARTNLMSSVRSGLNSMLEAVREEMEEQAPKRDASYWKALNKDYGWLLAEALDPAASEGSTLYNGTARFLTLLDDIVVREEHSTALDPTLE